MEIKRTKREPGRTARPVTEDTKEHSAQLKAAIAELESFANTLSHDLRAPLRAINTLTNVVLEDYGAGLDPGAKDLLQQVLASAARMDRLIQNVSAFTRLSRQTPELLLVDVEKLVREVCATSDFKDRPADIQIKSPLLPVRGYEPFLRACLTNLLDNAAKFIAPGVKPKISIGTQPCGDRVQLWVQDNGIGVPPESQEKIFQLFERLSSDYEGNGLGLAIVRKAAERMGGRVGVESTPGQGSRFWLELPKAAA